MLIRGLCARRSARVKLYGCCARVQWRGTEGGGDLFGQYESRGAQRGFAGSPGSVSWAGW